MDPLPVLIQDGLISARLWMPVVKEWLDPEAPVRIRRQINLTDVREVDQVAVVDSMFASALLQDHLIVPNVALASREVSALNFVTGDRPDGVDEVVLSTVNVSMTGRAVAETVIPQYYGIRILEWTDQQHTVQGNYAVITEGDEALVQLPNDASYHEDLGRAWFLFTDAPLVSHVCLAPARIAMNKPERVVATIRLLENLLDASVEYARELRRNLSRDHDIDRELITEILAGQTTQLGEQEIAGLSTLYVQSGVIRDPATLHKSIWSISG